MDSPYGIISVGDKTGLQFIVILAESLKLCVNCNMMDISVTNCLDGNCSSNVGSKRLNNFILFSEKCDGANIHLIAT